jgi:hypothetical protein
MSNRFDLLSRETTRRRLRASALKRRRIIVAASRVIEHAVDYSIERVAGGIDGVA